jgi:hypothetical protein
MYQVYLVHTDQQYIDIYIYIDSISLLIFTHHRVCFNSIDDDDDDETTGNKYINHYSTKT